MPYIEQSMRDEIDGAINELAGKITNTIRDDPEQVGGVLNYTITRLVDALGPYPNNPGSWSYAKIQRMVGMLTCVANEFYDRVARPYEDTKISANGDVYTGNQT
jgi:hypothetical protein